MWHLRQASSLPSACSTMRGRERHAPGGIECAVGIVAIGAFDHAFVHAMLEGHGELRADAGVAGVAQLGLLLFGQQKSGAVDL